MHSIIVLRVDKQNFFSKHCYLSCMLANDPKIIMASKMYLGIDTRKSNNKGTYHPDHPLSEKYSSHNCSMQISIVQLLFVAEHASLSLTWSQTPRTISIYHECEGGLDKSVPRITDWHHEA